MRLHLAGRHAPDVQGQDLVVEARQPDLALADELGLELAVAVAGDVDLELAVAVDDPLGGLAVAGVTGAVALRRVSLLAEVIGHLGVQGTLDQAPLEVLEQAGVLQKFFCGRVLGQLLDQVIDPVGFLLLGHGGPPIGEITPWLFTQLEIHSPVVSNSCVPARP